MLPLALEPRIPIAAIAAIASPNPPVLTTPQQAKEQHPTIEKLSMIDLHKYALTSSLLCGHVFFPSFPLEFLLRKNFRL
jgi:hypothetical protein